MLPKINEALFPDSPVGAASISEEVDVDDSAKSAEETVEEELADQMLMILVAGIILGADIEQLVRNKLLKMTEKRYSRAALALKEPGGGADYDTR
jgi:hypothetical protein